MPKPLLTTKFYIPALRPEFVPRPRLIEHLNRGLNSKLTLISAPAGFGKTTLMSAWINQSDIPVSWLSLERNDNDLGRFLAYFIASLQSIQIEVDAQVLTLLQERQPNKIEALLIPLINQIALVEYHFTLILDDYHLIQSQDIHEALTYLLEYLPPNMHILIASRADPPLHLARLRARGQMTEIRTSDLRFSVEEGNSLLNQIQGLELSHESIQALVNRTDGWIAALQMASIALKGKKDVVGYIRNFSGSRDYIADYLTSEVIDQQPKNIYDFLLKTAILDRLSGALCDAVTGQKDSQQILKSLKDENLFLMPLDDESHWFRYHRLFADLLNQRLLETDSSLVASLYRMASEWFETHEFPAEAIDYALRGNLVQRAASLIETQAEPTLIRSEIDTFIRWVEQLPEDVIFSRPSLGIYYAWALLTSNQKPETVNRVLEEITPTNGNLKGQYLAVKSIQAAFQRQIPEAIRLARQALQQLPQDDLFFRQITAWSLSASLFLTGDSQEGVRMLEEVARVSLASGNRMVAIITLSRLGAIRVQQGDLYEAHAFYHQALEIALENRNTPLPAACEAMLGLGKIHWEWFEFEAARNFLVDGIKLCKRWRDVTALEGHITLAYLLQSQGDNKGATQSMDIAQEITSKNTYPHYGHQYVALHQAYLDLRQGNISSAAEWATKRELEIFIHQRNLETTGKIGADVIRNYELMIYVRILMAEKQFVEAYDLLANLRPGLEQLAHQAKIIESHILTSMVLNAQGKTAQATTSIETALRLAAPAGFIRIFWDEGPEIIALVKKVNTQGKYVNFTQKILSAGTKGSVEIAKPERISNLVEPLSEREAEVLKLLQSDLSAPEIADQIHISVSTLRTHIKNIYAKLGVHSRFEAITKGRDLDLI